MDGLAIFLIIWIAICAASPKSVGRWAAQVTRAYRLALSQDTKVQS